MSVLLDPSVWVRHFRASNKHVVQLLEEERALVYDNVVGELACSSLKARALTLNASLWTVDKRLQQIAAEMNVAYSTPSAH